MSDTSPDTPHPPTVFYDGVCLLCNRFVRYVLDHDESGRIEFVAQQTERARRMLAPYGITPDQEGTVLFLSQGKLYRKSAAALAIGEAMGGMQAWLSRFGWWVPTPLRDWTYDWVARNRYRWFGQTSGEETCALPPPEQRSRVHDAPLSSPQTS